MGMLLKSKQNIVFVESLPRKTVTGISDWVMASSGKNVKKTKVGRTKDSIMALYSGKVGGLANYISYREWLDEDGKVKKDANGNTLTLQDKYEKKFNKPAGFFTNAPYRKADYGKSPTYFQKKSWKLNDGSTAFDLDTMDGLMGYYVLLDSKFVANSLREYQEHKWPEAKYYISIEHEDETITYNKNERKGKAFAKLYDKVMTDTTKRKLVDILELSSATAVLTSEQTHNLLFNYIDKTGYTPGSNLDKFNSITVLLNNAAGRKEFAAKHLLKQALDTRVIYEKQGTYTWIGPDGKVDIGATYQEAIDFLQDPKKESIVESIEEQIKAKL